MSRCGWARNELAIRYHDEEWGVPVHDDRKLFEMLILEGAQAGLSWITVLRRRETYRLAFDGFDPEKIALYDDRKKAELLQDEGIIRNRAKVDAAVQNARAYLEIREKEGSLDRFLWQFVGGVPKQNRWKDKAQMLPETPESKAMSKELRKRGFTFVGPTICYAFMQAVGMVNDHLTSCFRHREVKGL